MAEDFEAVLSAMEEAAPETPDVEDVTPGAAADTAATEAKTQADDWKPPSREEHENIQKALRSEREARRAAAQKAATYEQNVATMEQRFREMQNQQWQQRIGYVPDQNATADDLYNWGQDQQQLAQSLFQQRQQEEQTRAQQKAAEDRRNMLWASVQDYEAEFRPQHQDYDAAVEHVMKFQRGVLENMGFTAQQANASVEGWAESLAMQALQTGRNPAQVIYDMAKQAGYAPAPAPNAQAAADKIAQIKAGQDSAKTLSGGGTPLNGSPSLASIANLKGAAFDAAFNKFLKDAISG